eukprot:gi/632952045/ref/XP_007891629.1/ PREDICTED: uncharacterized protein LOC103178601 [Callorhinchus milii]
MRSEKEHSSGKVLREEANTPNDQKGIKNKNEREIANILNDYFLEFFDWGRSTVLSNIQHTSFCTDIQVPFRWWMSFLTLLFSLISINTLTGISIIRYIKGSESHKVSFVICTAFNLAWSPTPSPTPPAHAVISMWSACGYNVQVIISSSVCLITISASIYIPIIYFGTSPKFRTNVPALFYCLKEENNTSFVKPVNHINERMKTDPLNQADKHQVPKVPVAPTMAENPDLPEMPASNTNTPNIGLTSGQCDLHLSRMEGDSDL